MMGAHSLKRTMGWWSLKRASAVGWVTITKNLPQWSPVTSIPATPWNQIFLISFRKCWSGDCWTTLPRPKPSTLTLLQRPSSWPLFNVLLAVTNAHSQSTRWIRLALMIVFLNSVSCPVCSSASDMGTIFGVSLAPSWDVPILLGIWLRSAWRLKGNSSLIDLILCETLSKYLKVTDFMVCYVSACVHVYMCVEKWRPEENAMLWCVLLYCSLPCSLKTGFLTSWTWLNLELASLGQGWVASMPKQFFCLGPLQCWEHAWTCLYERHANVEDARGKP